MSGDEIFFFSVFLFVAPLGLYQLMRFDNSLGSAEMCQPALGPTVSLLSDYGFHFVNNSHWGCLFGSFVLFLKILHKGKVSFWYLPYHR